VSTQDLAEFLASLTCSPWGKHAYYRAIRAFYTWALENGHIEASPVNRMKAPKVPKPLRHTVKLEDVWDSLRPERSGVYRRVQGVVRPNPLPEIQLRYVYQ
jgi:site-specific recombinase XerD